MIRDLRGSAKQWLLIIAIVGIGLILLSDSFRTNQPTIENTSSQGQQVGIDGANLDMPMTTSDYEQKYAEELKTVLGGTIVTGKQIGRAHV